jgi:plastocyanin
MRFVVIAVSVVVFAQSCGGSAQKKDASVSGDAGDAGDAVSDSAGSDVGADDATTVDAGLDSAPDAPIEPFTAIDPCPTSDAYVAGGGHIATSDHAYLPACLRVPAGSTVTIEASTFHPLEPASGGSPGNPIPVQIIDATVTFSAPGFYPFYCPEHVGQGMRGVVWVTGS